MELKSLIISGACLRPNGFELGEGKYYGEAKLLKLNLQTGGYTGLLSKRSGGTNYPKEHPNLQYTAACLDRDILWLPTDTELYKYQLPSMQLLVCYSYPCFHNLHSVHVFGDEVVVTSTGLDNVVVLDKNDGSIKQVINTQGKDPWHRFDPHFDYRQVHSTRPHDSHPNYVFKLDGNLWVTRCTQEDAVNLSDVAQRIDISGDDNISVHDGICWQGKIVFTRVDGYLVVCDQQSKRVIEVINPFAGEKNKPIGWCRGLCIIGDLFYIGYSKLRQTKLTDKLKYLAQGNLKYTSGNNALVVAYDIKSRRVERVYESPDHTLDAIYGVLPFHYD